MKPTPLMSLAACWVIAGCGTLPPAPYQVQGDSITAPLTATPGDPARGREVIAGRDGNCLLCHAIPETGERFMGNVGPPLSGIGARLSAGQLRLRIADPVKLNRDAIMPSYYRVHGLDRVAAPHDGKPILTAQQIEDVVAYLLTVR